MNFTVFKPSRSPAPTVTVDSSDSNLGTPIVLSPPALSRSLRSQTTDKPFGLNSYSMNDSAEDLAYNIAILQNEDLIYSNLPDDLRVVESDNTRKATVQKGHSAFWYITEQPLAPSNEGATLPEACWNAVADFFGSKNPIPITMTMSATRRTNLGWPTFISGGSPLADLGLYVMSNFALLVRDKGHKAGLDIASDMLSRYKWSLDPCMVAFSRSRHKSKATREWVPYSTGCSSSSESSGLACGMRFVFGQLGFINLALRPDAILLKSKLYSDPSFHVTSEADFLRWASSMHRKGWSAFSEDISGFDLSVASNSMMNLCDVYSRMGASKNFRDAFIWHISAPVLTPPFDSSNEGFLLRKDGCISSGWITTDIDGSIINFARVLYCVATAAGVSFFQAIKDKAVKWDVKIKGDDTVVFFAPGYLEADVYSASNSDIGFKTDLLPGVVFLMTYYNLAEGQFYGLIGRALMQTFFREHEPAGPFTEALGLYVRTSRCQGHPNYSIMMDTLERHPSKLDLCRSLGIQSLSQLSTALLSPSFVEGFQKETSSPAGKKWLHNFINGITQGQGLREGSSSIDPAALKLLGLVDDSRIQLFKITDSDLDPKILMKDWLALIYTEIYDDEGNTIPLEKKDNQLKTMPALNRLFKQGGAGLVLDDGLHFKQKL